MRGDQHGAQQAPRARHASVREVTLTEREQAFLLDMLARPGSAAGGNRYEMVPRLMAHGLLVAVKPAYLGARYGFKVTQKGRAALGVA